MVLMLNKKRKNNHTSIVFKLALRLPSWIWLVIVWRAFCHNLLFSFHFNAKREKKKTKKKIRTVILFGFRTKGRI